MGNNLRIISKLALSAPQRKKWGNEYNEAVTEYLGLMLVDDMLQGVRRINVIL